MSVIITVDEAQVNLKDIVRRLAPGEEIVLTDNQQSVARLVRDAAKPKQGLRPPPGLGKDMITFIAPDFDAPLPEMKEYLE